MRDLDTIIRESYRLAGYYPEILPPIEVIQTAREIGAQSEKITSKQLGNEIDLYTVGDSKENTLWYGFPDPGEAIGGTTILCLMKALAANDDFLTSMDINWNFIPCTNFKDQPAGGTRLEKTKKTAKQEIDWMIDSPRPETTALVELARELRPTFTYPLHDEYHSEEIVPAYIPVSKVISQCENIRSILSHFKIEIAKECHKQMGEGFIEMSSAPDYTNSTFSRFAEHGTVAICELPNTKNDRELIAAQIAVGLTLLGDK